MAVMLSRADTARIGLALVHISELGVTHQVACRVLLPPSKLCRVHASAVIVELRIMGRGSADARGPRRQVVCRDPSKLCLHGHERV